MADTALPTPQGFSSYTARLGLKDDSDDVAVVRSDRPAVSAAVFTQSRFSGASVLLSREAMAAGPFQAVLVLSKNANVATGAEGRANAVEVRAAVAAANGLEESQVLISSTGVIGVQYPMPALRPALAELPPTGPGADYEAVATAMMTTDTRAKGVGMIEPNMATLLTYFFTDAELTSEELDRVFRSVIATTFNALSIDTDTSTSDTAAILANGAAGRVDPAAFEAGLHEVALALTRDIASDGEGASKLIEVRVRGARDDVQAKRVAKAVVNSPLVKTAVHGADPNWGRVAMAVGKLDDELDIDPRRVSIAFGDTTVYPELVDDDVLAGLRSYLRGDEVVIEVGLGIADGRFTVYGCDLTEGYIRINADYTT